MGAKLAGLRAGLAFPGPSRQVPEQTFCIRGFRRPAESRTQALGRVRGERELRHQQDRSAGFGDRHVHAPGGIFEHAIVQQPIEQTLGRLLVIAALDGNEHQQTRADARELAAPDHDGCTGHALQQPDQILPALIARRIIPVKTVQDAVEHG